ncbi:MAG TPA: MBOAT family O-acyltransferase [Acidimicrobiales bacterium]
MLFPTVAFAVFFVAAFTANWLLRPYHLVWRATMVALSLYFCGWVDIRFALLVVAMAAVNAAAAGAARRAMPAGSPTPRSRRIVRVAVAADIAALALLAYHGFLVDAVSGALSSLGLSPGEPVLGLLVPVGISFFTLHAISYVVDVGRGDVEPVAFADVLLYLCFFPHLVAGPVVRVDELVPQFHERPDPRRVPATDAFVLVGVGLAKAVVVASFLGAEVVDPAFADPSAAGGGELLVAVYAFAVQVYAGFSGATDIAIGCALLLGIHYPLAFDAPYRALSLREFWQRWNTTVSLWLRDYVYLPLGGSRGTPPAAYRNLMITAVLGGLWYGPGWTFVAWGALHGAFLAGERAWRRWWAARSPGPAGPALPVVAVLRWALTFHLVCLAWIVYRADSVGAGVEIVGRIATAAGGDAGVVGGLALATVAVALAAQLLPLPQLLGLQARFSLLGPAAQAVVLAASLTVVGALGPDGPAPFGYLPF